jgi:hypothetical protein
MSEPEDNLVEVEESTGRGIIFNKTAGKKWLYTARVGFQDVAIVVCRDLPLEPKFYKWLIFALLTVRLGNRLLRN